jgi:hypothetical protein
VRFHERDADDANGGQIVMGCNSKCIHCCCDNHHYQPNCGAGVESSFKAKQAWARLGHIVEIGCFTKYMLVRHHAVGWQ